MHRNSLAAFRRPFALRLAPLAGGLASFEVRLFNRGPVDMDVIVARENGGQPGDVAIAVKNIAGQEVARTAFMGAPPPNIQSSSGPWPFLSEWHSQQ